MSSSSSTSLQPPRWDTHAHVFAGAVKAGSHYTPAEHTVQMWQSAAAASGIERVVLVQPSVYGTDNSVMLNALRHSGGVHRGVAVVAPDVTDAALADMHAAGVRGVRFNLVSPVGNDPAHVDAIIARVRPLGWHAQFFLRPAQYSWIREHQKGWGVAVVLDHVGGMHADYPAQSHLDALCALADQGAWVKLSGFYRLGTAAPFREIDALIEKLHPRFAGRMLWGSDWPHTWYMEAARGAAPSYESLLAPLARAFPDVTTKESILCGAPALLYQ